MSQDTFISISKRLSPAFQDRYAQVKCVLLLLCIAIIIILLHLFANFIVFLFIVVSVILLCFWLLFRAEKVAVNGYLKAVEKQFTSAVRSYYESPTEPQLNQESHLLLLGLPGSGKTKMLEKYLCNTAINFNPSQNKIPILIQMKYYNAFLIDLKNSTAPLPTDTLLTYLLKSKIIHPQKMQKEHEQELIGIQRLRLYLPQLLQDGKIVLLCDGMNELSENVQDIVREELTQIMQATQNRIIMTCRELDFNESETLKNLYNSGPMRTTMLRPLRREEVYQFAECYLTHQDISELPASQGGLSNDAILHHILTMNTHYEYTNPFMLVAFIQMLQHLSLQQAQLINSRGKLLRTYVDQLIDDASLDSDDKQDVLLFLSAVAFFARSEGQRNAIQVGNARKLSEWLESSAGDTDPLYISYDVNKVETLREIALKAGLITISSYGTLSFRHELIAEYFAAFYLEEMHSQQQGTVPFWETLFSSEDAVATWSEPIAIWAGQKNEPMELAKSFIEWAETYTLAHPDYNPEAPVIEMSNVLALSLACAGVLWKPSSPNSHRLPKNIDNLLKRYIPIERERERLASIFKHCADEGGIEVYQALLPQLTVEGMPQLFLLLHTLHSAHTDRVTIPNLLFDYLMKVVGEPAYAKEEELLISILGELGADIVPLAEPHSQPQTTELPLRIAAISILGRTKQADVVVPLLRYLYEPQQAIWKAATSALIHCGSDPALNQVALLHNQQQGRERERLLDILEGFLRQEQLTAPQSSYKKIINIISKFLQDDYSTAKQIQATDILSEQIKRGKDYTEAVVNILLHQIDTTDQQQAGYIQKILVDNYSHASLLRHIIAFWQRREPPQDLARLRIVTVLGSVSNHHAMDFLLSLLNEQEPKVKTRIRNALRNYAPDSIKGLISTILDPLSSAAATQLAAATLKEIGPSSIDAICNALPVIETQRGTHLLVGVIDYLRPQLPALPNEQIISVLCDLLKFLVPEQIPLSVFVTRVIGKFSDRRIVSPLIQLLARPEPALYEQAIIELSHLGDIAFADLINQLESMQETATTQRIRLIFSNTQPFPSQQLLDVFKHSSNALTRQVQWIFSENGSRTIDFLAQHWHDSDKRTTTYVRQTVQEIGPDLAIPALLAVLGNPDWIPELLPYLKKYPDLAIPQLVQQLSIHLSEPTIKTLLHFPTQLVLPYLIPGLENEQARPQAKRVIVAIAKRNQHDLSHIIQLFNPATARPPRAEVPQVVRRTLQELLTQELADMSIDALIAALKERPLVEDCASSLAILSRQPDRTETVITAASQALHDTHLLSGAKITLVKIGEAAFKYIKPLLGESEDTIVDAALDILSQMGSIAFPLLYELYNDPQTTSKATIIFRRMPSPDAAAALTQLLKSSNSQQIKMARYLLQTRLEEEKRAEHAEMITALLHEAVQDDNVRLPIIFELLFFASITQQHALVAQHIITAIKSSTVYHREFIDVLLILGRHSIEALEEIIKLDTALNQIRLEAMSILAFLAPERVDGHIANLANKNSKELDTNQRLPELSPLAMQFRAYGGALASGIYNEDRLYRERDSHPVSSSAYEFYDIQLGQRNMPHINQVEREKAQLEAHIANEQHLREQAEARATNEQHLRERAEARATNEQHLREQAEARAATLERENAALRAKHS